MRRKTGGLSLFKLKRILQEIFWKEKENCGAHQTSLWIFFSFNKNESVQTTPNIYVAQTKLENSYMSGGCQISQIMLEKKRLL